jgi:hypothetical protein
VVRAVKHVSYENRLTKRRVIPFLNRYTSLPIALDVLSKKRITLLSPEAWEDRNDAYFLEAYREKKNLRSVLAICFSLRRETFHHWRIFSNGSAGVCIEFDKRKLLRTIGTEKGFRHGEVAYQLIHSLEKTSPALDTWPFLKRKPFEDENEYRILFESRTARRRERSVAISLSAIVKITLSPWLPNGVESSIIETIKSIDGCSGLKVKRSSLIENVRWRKVIDKASGEYA